MGEDTYGESAMYDHIYNSYTNVYVLTEGPIKTGWGACASCTTMQGREGGYLRVAAMCPLCNQVQVVLVKLAPDERAPVDVGGVSLVMLRKLVLRQGVSHFQLPLQRVN